MMTTVPEGVSEQMVDLNNNLPSWVDLTNPDHLARLGLPLKPVCCWPDCPKRTWEDTPLCEAHVQITANLWNEHWRPKPADEGPRDERPGWIYYLQVGQHIKIGWTKNIESRLKYYPRTAVLLAAEPGTLSREQQIHKDLTAVLAAGKEWYHDTPTVRGLIDHALAEHGRHWDPKPTKPGPSMRPRTRNRPASAYRGR
jgi:hypothetical protein